MWKKVKTGKINFTTYSIYINQHYHFNVITYTFSGLNSHVWPVAARLDKTGSELLQKWGLFVSRGSFTSLPPPPPTAQPSAPLCLFQGSLFSTFPSPWGTPQACDGKDPDNSRAWRRWAGERQGSGQNRCTCAPPLTIPGGDRDPKGQLNMSVTHLAPNSEDSICSGPETPQCLTKELWG